MNLWYKYNNILTLNRDGICYKFLTNKYLNSKIEFKGYNPFKGKMDIVTDKGIVFDEKIYN